jgi:hypothetical protein
MAEWSIALVLKDCASTAQSLQAIDLQAFFRKMLARRPCKDLQRAGWNGAANAPSTLPMIDRRDGRVVDCTGPESRKHRLPKLLM